MSYLARYFFIVWWKRSALSQVWGADSSRQRRSWTCPEVGPAAHPFLVPLYAVPYAQASGRRRRRPGASKGRSEPANRGLDMARQSILN
jgi:hypothetical protein